MTQAKQAASNLLGQLALHLAGALTADDATAPLPPALASFLTPGTSKMQKVGLAPVVANVVGLTRRPGVRAPAYCRLRSSVHAGGVAGLTPEPTVWHDTPYRCDNTTLGNLCGHF